MSQLHDDLHIHINERLRTWIADSVDLYCMAGLRQREALVDILSSLLMVAAGITVVFDLDQDVVIKELKRAIARQRKIAEKEAARRES